eukprot:COSAG04_NODE_81_length_27945_cov_46.142821_16_plen_172_part_00
MYSVPKGVETVKFSKMGEGVVFLDDDAELEAVIEEAEMEAAAEPDNKAKAPLVRTRPMSTSLFFCVDLSCKSQNARKEAFRGTSMPAVLSIRSNEVLLLTRSSVCRGQIRNIVIKRREYTPPPTPSESSSEEEEEEEEFDPEAFAAEAARKNEAAALVIECRWRVFSARRE